MLFLHLYHMQHLFLKAMMICQNRKVVTHQILSPLLYGNGNGRKLSDVSGRMKKFGVEGFAKEGNEMILLRQDSFHTYP